MAVVTFDDTYRNPKPGVIEPDNLVPETPVPTIDEQADKYGEIKSTSVLNEAKERTGRWFNILGNAVLGDIPFVRTLLPDRVREARPQSKSEKIVAPLTSIIRDIGLFVAPSATVAKVGAKAAPFLAPLFKVAPKTTRAVTTMVGEGTKGAIVGAVTADSEDPEKIAKHAAIFGALVAGTTPVMEVVAAGGKKIATQMAKSEKLMWVGQQLGLALKNNKVTNLVRERYGAINSRLIDSAVFVDSLEKQLSKQEEKILPYLVEKSVPEGMLKGISKERVVELEGVAEKIGTYLDSAHKDLMGQYGKDIGFIENYIPHIWDIPKNKETAVVNWFATKNPHLKQRIIPTIAEGIEKFGLTPKYEKVTDLIKVYDNIRIKAAANVKFVKELDKLQDDTGMKLIQRADKAPENWKVVDHPAVRRAMMVGKTKVNVPVTDTFTTISNTIEKITNIVKTIPGGSVKESTSGPIKKLEEVMVGALETRGMGNNEANAYLGRLRSAYAGAEVVGDATSETVSRTVKNKVSKIYNEIEKKFPVEVPIISKVPIKVHPEIFNEVNAVLDNYKPGSFVKALDTFNLFAKQSALNFSLFHHTALTETGIAAGIGADAMKIWNPVKIIRSFKNGTYKQVLEKNIIAKGAVKDGLELGAISDVEGGRSLVEALKGAEKGLNNEAAAAGVKYLVRKPMEFNNKFLWDYLHTTYKLSAYTKLKHDMVKRFPEKDIKTIGVEVAQMVNDTFGGQAWDILGKSAKWKMASRFMLLSPDWTLSTMRQAMSPAGVGAASKAGVEIRQEMGKDFWRKALVYFGGSMNMLNYTFTKAEYGEGRYMWDNAPGSKTHLFIGKNPDGTERYLRWGKQFRELAEVINDPPEVAMRKVSPIARMAQAQFKPHPQWQKEIEENPFWSFAGMKARGVEAVKGITPFSLNNQLRMGEVRPLSFALPEKKGMSMYSLREGLENSIKQGDEQMFFDYIEAGLNNGLDSAGAAKRAKASIKAEITYESTKKAHKIFDKLYKLDDEERKEYFNRLQEKGELTSKLNKALLKIMRTNSSVAKQKAAFKKYMNKEQNGK